MNSSGRERHRAVPRPSVAAVVLEAEGDATVIEANQSAVRDGDAVGVASEVGEHRLGPAKGGLA
jgi:cobalamin biosynthesis protein CbiG